jgi:hypothetical protein
LQDLPLAGAQTLKGFFGGGFVGDMVDQAFGQLSAEMVPAFGLAAVLDDGDDFHVGLRLDQAAQAFGHDAVIVGDQNPDRHFSTEPAR